MIKKIILLTVLISTCSVLGQASSLNAQLLQAALKGNLDTVHKSLNEGADVNTADDNGVTALIIAAQNGHTQVVNKLLIAGANMNSQTKRNKKTALMLAATNGHLPIVKRLIDAGADKTLKNRQGQTAFDLANTDEIKKLFQENKELNNNLLVAASNGNHIEVNRLLAAGAQVDTQNAQGETPLTMAVTKGHSEIVKILINANANVNLASFRGTPLQLAAFFGYPEVVSRLLKAGAKITKNQRGQTPFDITQNKEIKNLILQAQEKRTQIEKIKPLVFDLLEIIKTQQEILTMNEEYKKVEKQKKEKKIQEIQKELIAKEKNLEFKLNKFKKSLSLILNITDIADNNLLELFKTLMKKVTMNITDKDGNTPLHKAVEMGNPKLIEWIVKFQPDLATRENKAKQTPLELAAGRPEILKLFMGLKN